MGLIDQTTEAWERWYLGMHELPALRQVAAAGYEMIEIHFLYGTGLLGEREEIELTRKMTANAHQVGLRVLGYFQFFSVQGEMFLLENPWARECLQLDADGKPRLYRYDRPALCFSHERVRQYYLDGIELGLGYCDLDGIRLDNDYYKGCYCPRCQEAFRWYLRETYDADATRRLFGYPTLEGVSLVPFANPGDPLWAAQVRFRRRERQEMMRRLSEKLRSIKPDAVLGGNPAVIRNAEDVLRCHVYLPDLGETHDLVCAENSLFPGRTGDSLRHQVLAYKYGQANGFRVFASHHIYGEDDRMRWPETTAECALSLCEALCFGGHVPCTTWGLRMDGNEHETLYQRPHFMAATQAIAAFLRAAGGVYRTARCAAAVGVYTNAEAQVCDATTCWNSLHGVLQVLLREHVPFRLVSRDDDDALADVALLIIPNVRLISRAQITRLLRFLERSGARLLCTGETGRFDEHFLRHEGPELNDLLNHPRVTRLADTPEAMAPTAADTHGVNARHFPLPAGAARLAREIDSLLPESPWSVRASAFVAVEAATNDQGERFLHLLNYDNTRPTDVRIAVAAGVGAVSVLAPDGFGPASPPTITAAAGGVQVVLPRLDTYAVIRVAAAEAAGTGVG